jgi:alanine racemase
MNRLGLSLKDMDAPDLRDLLARVELRYVMSHLATADDPAQPMNAAQLARLRGAVAALGRPVRVSFANSAGILLGPDYHFDLARPGCGLYGINPAAGPNPMQGVVLLRARILQIRAVAAGETIGYGASYTVPKAENNGIKTYATLALGYADGFLRSLAGRGHVVIGGVACPLAGRVSMDSVVADISALPVPPAAGDWAEIIGPHQPVDAVAAMAGTIGYEILTSLGRRYHRIYKGTDA